MTIFLFGDKSEMSFLSIETGLLLSGVFVFLNLLTTIELSLYRKDLIGDLELSLIPNYLTHDFLLLAPHLGF